MSANRLAQMCPQNMYPRAPLSRRHYLKVAKKSDGGVFFKLHAFPPRTWGGCAAREGGLAGWKCARRAACGAPGGLCTRSTSRMVVGQAPVAARGALRALKPRAAPWRRGEGSVARAYLLPRTLASRGQKDVGQLRFCQCQQFFLFAMVGMVWISHPSSGTKYPVSIAWHGMGGSLVPRY